MLNILHIFGQLCTFQFSTNGQKSACKWLWIVINYIHVASIYANSYLNFISPCKYSNEHFASDVLSTRSWYSFGKFFTVCIARICINIRLFSHAVCIFNSLARNKFQQGELHFHRGTRKFSCEPSGSLCYIPEVFVLLSSLRQRFTE